MNKLIKILLPVVTIPVEIILKDGVLPVGHHQLKGEKTDDNNVVLRLYQAQYMMAELPAIEQMMILMRKQ